MNEAEKTSQPTEKPSDLKVEKKTTLVKIKWFNIAALFIAFILAVLFGFALGLKVGFHKAKFSYRWGENYERNFTGPPPHWGKPGFIKPMMRGFEGRDFRNAHGVAGSIISITDNKLIIKDRDGNENTVAITDSTIIKKARFQNLKLSDLKENDEVVAIGKPDDSGVVNAILIRVFDKNQGN